MGGWFGGKPERRGSTFRSGIRKERFSRMIKPRRPCPSGRAPICRRLSIVHPARDELLDAAVGVDDAHGGVLRSNERTDAIDDDLQRVINGGQSGDAPNGGIEGSLDLVKAACHRRIRVEHPWRG